MSFVGLNSDLPQAPCGVIAQEMGDKATRKFTKSDSDDYWNGPGCYNRWRRCRPLRAPTFILNRRRQGVKYQKCRVTLISMPFGAQSACDRPSFFSSMASIHSIIKI